MKTVSAKGCLIVFIVLVVQSVSVQANTILFREDFNDLDNWRPLTFPKISKHSTYTIETDKDNAFLRAESNASASGLIYKKEYDVFDYPKVRWRWKIENVYQKGNAEEKSG